MKIYPTKDSELLSLSHLIETIERIGKNERIIDKSLTIKREKEAVLRKIDQMIGKGETGLYVLRALLTASDNWDDFVIVRKDLFRSLLLEGIEHGALNPHNDLGWRYLDVATKSNNPEEFMNDIDRFYDILDIAMKEGNTIAYDIMNSIWEPEQIIEED